MDKLKHCSLQLPEDGCVVISMRHGKCYSIREINENEFIASLKTFLELAKAAGYTVVCPDEKNYNRDRA